MTPLGHLSISYLSGKAIPKISMTGIIIGGIAPDLDWLLYPFPFFNDIHRVISHNVFFALLIALIGFLIVKKKHQLPVTLGLLLGIILHIFFDSIIDTNPSNGIGTAWFWPVVDKNYAPFNIASNSVTHGLSWNGDFWELSGIGLKYFLVEVPFLLIAFYVLRKDRITGIYKLFKQR